MPRVVKHPELRRTEFLDFAEALFLSQGYDRVSLNSVISASGTSKGAFYHYFSSKEALVEALAERFARRVLIAAEEDSEDEKSSALSRLNMFFARARRFKVDVAPKSCGALGGLLRPENAILAERVSVATTALFVPVLAEMISDGIAAGEFSTTDPDGVAEMILQFTNSLQRTLSQADLSQGETGLSDVIDVLQRRLKLYGVALDRILGIPDGSVELIEPGYVRRMTVGILLPMAERK